MTDDSELHQLQSRFDGGNEASKTPDWSDVVFLDNIGVKGKNLSDVLNEFANRTDNHDGLPCHCDFCQAFVPMAIKLESELAAARQALEAAEREAAKACTDALAKVMLDNGLATGHGENFKELLAELETQLRENRTRAAQDATEVDGYGALLAEGQLGRRAIEWCANSTYWHYSKNRSFQCKYCKSLDVNAPSKIIHLESCLYLAAKQWQAAAVAGRGEAGKS